MLCLPLLGPERPPKIGAALSYDVVCPLAKALVFVHNLLLLFGRRQVPMVGPREQDWFENARPIGPSLPIFAILSLSLGWSSVPSCRPLRLPDWLDRRRILSQILCRNYPVSAATMKTTETLLVKLMRTIALVPIAKSSFPILLAAYRPTSVDNKDC